MLTDNILKDRTVSQSNNSVRKRQKLGVSRGGKKKTKTKTILYLHTACTRIDHWGNFLC